MSSTPDSSNLEMLHKEVNDKAYKLRQMRGEDLERLDVEGLRQLEKKLEAGLSLVIKTEEERASTKINELQGKEAQLIKENKQLKQKADEGRGSGGGGRGEIGTIREQTRGGTEPRAQD